MEDKGRTVGLHAYYGGSAMNGGGLYGGQGGVGKDYGALGGGLGVDAMRYSGGGKVECRYNMDMSHPAVAAVNFAAATTMDAAGAYHEKGLPPVNYTDMLELLIHSKQQQQQQQQQLDAKQASLGAVQASIPMKQQLQQQMYSYPTPPASRPHPLHHQQQQQQMMYGDVHATYPGSGSPFIPSSRGVEMTSPEVFPSLRPPYPQQQQQQQTPASAPSITGDSHLHLSASVTPQAAPSQYQQQSPMTSSGGQCGDQQSSNFTVYPWMRSVSMGKWP